ncbi:MAG TPA: DUF2147 domain-containing protein [Sphingomicrobium sp.]|nr:DUF2147 domain-containing protein [Sphingomicrobium sp.]
MKRLILCAAMLGALAAAPAAGSNRAPIEGRWKNGQMEIEISPCGQNLCGTVVRASPKQRAKAEKGSGTNLVGARLIREIQPAGQGTYRANVFVADRNMHARGTIRQVSANRLDVKGCALLVVCKSSTWDRVR